MTLSPAFPRPLLYAALGATLGAALAWYGPPGTDLAAHVYQRALFLRNGFSLWNNYWYAGRYSFVTYSLFYYPLAGVAGIKLLATTSVAIGAGAFAAIVEREWGRSVRRISWVFAIAFAASVLLAAFPYLLGMAFALVSLYVLQARRFKTFGLAVLATFGASPLAFVLLVVILAAAWTRSRHLFAKGLLPVAATGALGAALWRLFPGNGRFPFALTELAAVLLFCGAGLAFTWRVERARLLFSIFAVYALACVVCYLIPSGIGANVVRLRFVAVPIAALTLSLRRWKPLLPALAALGLALAWNVTPLAFSYARGVNDPSASPSYWAAAIRFLHHHLKPAYRVEAVDTTDHWEADYLPTAGIPLVRGWFRQDDFPQNALLYNPLLRANTYSRWLHEMAVRYVVLTNAPVDYSSQSEARLLRSGRSGLPVVFRNADTTIFSVPSPVSIVTGPRHPQVLALRSNNIVIDLHRAGTYHLALRYTPYWSAANACVTETPDGMINVRAKRTGVIQLSFVMNAENVLHAITGTQSSCSGTGN